jgi:hypothetical protein
MLGASRKQPALSAGEDAFPGYSVASRWSQPTTLSSSLLNDGLSGT